MNKKLIALIPLMAGLMAVTGCNAKPKSEEKSYTYRSAISATPTTWNPHEWETNDDSIVLGFTTSGLYEFCFNDARNGYEILPEMAASEPVDVSDEMTDEEVKKYGVVPAADEHEGTYKGYKWQVNLREDAVWENGEAINADTYVYSMQQILNPKMMNYRANSYYSGSVAIGNAKNYYQGGNAKYEFFTSSAESVDGKQYFSFYEPVQASRTYAGETYADYSIYSWYNDDTYSSQFSKYYSGQADERAHGLIKQQSGDWGTVSIPSFIEVDEKTKPLILDYLEEWCQVVLDSSFSESQLKYFTFKKTGIFDPMEYAGDNKAVGCIKTGPYQLTIYTSAKTTAFDFKYNFSSNWIVYEPLYEANKQQIGTITKTKYATTKDNYMSFGPYKLSSYVQDKTIQLVKNEKYNFKKGEYQCTAIDLQVVPQHSTQLQLFLNGDLDDLSLEKEDMVNYGKSKQLFYEPNTYTSKVTFNTSFNKLVERQNKISKSGSLKNKTIIANQKFREAFFWSLDRKSFCQTLTAGSSAAVTPINSLYVADTSTGESYRSTKQGKSVVESLVGENVNGFDVEKARSLFQAAAAEENANTETGHWKKGQSIILEFKVYNSEDIYTKMMDFFKKAFAEATKDTDLEGKITIQKTVDPDYYETMQAGDSDMIYTTWGGAQLNPYGMLECYCDPDRMFEYGFEPTEETLTLEVGGKTVTKTYMDWSTALDGEGGEYSAANADKETRLTVLAGVELALCKQYRFVSVYARSSAYLLSYKIKTQGSDEYVPVMGYGSLKYYEFSYDDAEWEKVKTTFDYRK